MMTSAFIPNSPFRPKTEHELLERVDRSLAQADAGELQDADEAIDEVVAELGRTFSTSSTPSFKREDKRKAYEDMLKMKECSSFPVDFDYRSVKEDEVVSR